MNLDDENQNRCSSPSTLNSQSDFHGIPESNYFNQRFDVGQINVFHPSRLHKNKGRPSKAPENYPQEEEDSFDAPIETEAALLFTENVMPTPREDCSYNSECFSPENQSPIPRRLKHMRDRISKDTNIFQRLSGPIDSSVNFNESSRYSRKSLMVLKGAKKKIINASRAIGKIQVELDQQLLKQITGVDEAQKKRIPYRIAAISGHRLCWVFWDFFVLVLFLLHFLRLAFR